LRSVRWLERSRGRAGRVLAALGVIACCATGVFAARALSRARTAAPQSVGARASAEPSDPVSEARARLTQFEEQRRRATDFARLPPANLTHGADPYALARLDARHLVGVLRGASALVVLDNELRERGRTPVPESVVSVAVSAAGECWAGGETSAELRHYRLDGERLTRIESRKVPGILGIRALTPGPNGVLYALDVHDGRLLTLRPHAPYVEHAEHEWAESRYVGHGPLSLARVGAFLIVDLLLDHALVVYRLDSRGEVLDERARVVHDGPIWGFDAALSPTGELLLSATGVEDHPLDRSDGAFGYIDSFAFQYLLPKSGPVRRLWSANVSELGVITPKAPVLRLDGTHARLFVSGYGSDHAVEFAFESQETGAPRATALPFTPGTSGALLIAPDVLGFADPLLDAWLLWRESAAPPTKKIELRGVEAASAPRAPSDERLGEALFFTSLMSPANSSEGKHSRFTCETCHFEGYVDGRVHSTGRGDVRVSTKPLRGLFNNRPHFSRALDPDLATVSHHEFRVAGEGSGQDPWFSLKPADFPWLEALGVSGAELGPEALRRALMAFLMGFSHTTNPAVASRAGFDESEQRGAALFRDQCARCHAARLQSDVPESALPFEAWQQAIFSKAGPIVWASAEYQKTGVTPYVHESGARVPSLRRLYAKWPHFTNGSARTVADVVRGVRYDETRFFHQGAPSDPTLHSLSSDEARDLVAFLDLL
jgi:cytochrome c peroxidase